MKLRRKTPEPSKPKGYLYMGDQVLRGPCTCRWEPLGFTPASFTTDVVFVREGSLPPVAAGHIRYCRQHGGGAA